VDETELYTRFRSEFEALKDKRITIETTALSAWVFVSQVQLALRHPKNTGPSTKIARALAEKIIEQVAPPGTALREVAERGWNPNYDEPF
jgi:hypothetical protein